MRRPSPDISPPGWQPPAQEDGFTLHLRLITPLFGGGYEAREVDPVCIIRPATVRGNLRFWWRALYAGQYASAKELFRAEAELWGAAAYTSSDKKSSLSEGKVRLWIDVLNRGKPVPCAEYTRDPQKQRYKSIPRFREGYPPYALHPFQGRLAKGGKAVEEEPATAYEDVEFRLRLIFPRDLRPQVTSTVTAWVRYGGIGARTRRGCGSLMVVNAEEVNLAFPDVVFQPPKANMPITLLVGSQYVLGPAEKTALRAWAVAVQAYQAFRQGAGFARGVSQSHGRPGRSFYPEPDSIRRLLKTHSYHHRPEHPVELGFPRADLGLPIVFHFKDQGDGDPPDTSLQGPEKKRLRFASPVITKALPDGKGNFLPLVMVLNSPHVWWLDSLHLDVIGQNKSFSIARDHVNLGIEDLKKIKPLNGKPVREALLAYVSSQWKSPVQEWKP